MAAESPRYDLRLYYTERFPNLRPGKGRRFTVSY
jgi:hypothetical protein